MRKQEKFLTGIKNVDLMILAYLDDKDLVSVRSISKRAKEICSDENFWRNRILVQYPEVSYDIFKKYKGERKWSDYYVHDLVKIKEKNAQDVFDQSVEDGRLNRVIIAVYKGANISAYNDYALRMTAHDGNLEIVKLLIESGANIHTNDDKALRWASEEGHINIVRFLIKEGANIHADGDASLIWASENGYLEVVKFLTESGADIHAKNNEALRWARKNGHLDVVKYLEHQK